jgi:hypothetical protein
MNLETKMFIDGPTPNYHHINNGRLTKPTLPRINYYQADEDEWTSMKE